MKPEYFIRCRFYGGCLDGTTRDIKMPSQGLWVQTRTNGLDEYKRDGVDTDGMCKMTLERHVSADELKARLQR